MKLSVREKEKERMDGWTKQFRVTTFTHNN